MKNRFRSRFLAVCLSTLLFCFAGCDYIPTSDGDNYIPSHTTDDVRPIVDDTKSDDFSVDTPEEQAFKDGAFDDYIANWYGVRTLYTPNANSTTSNAMLSADRQKFNDNAYNQYVYMSNYILMALVNMYQTPVDDGTVCFDYEFFADNATFPNTIHYSYNFVASTDLATVATDAIQNNNWTFRLTPLTDESGVELPIETNYLSRYLSVFSPVLALQLMETDLGLGVSQTNMMIDLNTCTVNQNYIDTQKAQYVTQVNTLGIDRSKDYANLILENVIGTSATSVLLAPYDTKVGNIVSKFFDDIEPQFAHYSRTEFCDIDATQFFTPGDNSTDPTKLTNMDYQEYQSATFFYREDAAETMVNNAIDIYIDSREDIVLDVYCLYIEANGPQKIEYLATLHTDHTQSCYYSPDDPNDAVDSDTDTTNNENALNNLTTNNNTGLLYLDMTDDEIQSDPFYKAYIDTSSDTFGTTGYANVLYADANHPSVGAILERTDLSGNVWQLDTALKNGQTVDLSDISVYAPIDKDGMVIIFDIQYKDGGTVSSHDNGDYAFKYLIQIDGLTKSDFDESKNQTDEDTD